MVQPWNHLSRTNYWNCFFQNLDEEKHQFGFKNDVLASANWFSGMVHILVSERLAQVSINLEKVTLFGRFLFLRDKVLASSLAQDSNEPILGDMHAFPIFNSSTNSRSSSTSCLTH